MRGGGGLILSFKEIAEFRATSGDPDQTPRSVAFDLSLHCLPITLLEVSRLKWVKLSVYLNLCQAE